MHIRRRENNVQVSRLGIWIPILTTALLVAPHVLVGKSGEPRKTLVEVWCSGDDGLTLRLRDSIEKGFGSSSHFQLSEGKKPGTLIVLIPTNVPWEGKMGRTQVLYKVDFSLVDGRKLGTSKGTCWGDDLSSCATHVITDAERMVARIQQ